jgi:hypothetical protein
MANLQLIVSAGGWAGCAVSIYFNVRQHRRLKRKEEEARTDQIKREQTPPRFHNYDGSDDPISVSGKVHSVHGPFMDLNCLVTVVNTLPFPTKIKPSRLLVEGQEMTADVFFIEKNGTRERLKKISLRGNDKADYELHFLFPEQQCPVSQDGELWVYSDNRPEPFPIKLRFR